MKNKVAEKIIEYCNNLNFSEVNSFLQEYEIFAIRSEVFAVEKSKAERVKELISKYYLKIIYLGKKIGRIGNKFFPNVAFFELLFKYAKPEKIIELPYKKAWLFCCGRDLFLHKDGVFFLSYKGRFIGVASYEKKRKIMKNLFDIGIYIRNQAKL